MQRLTRQDKAISSVAYVVLTLLALVVMYPLYFIVIASISDPFLVNTGGVWIVPRGLNVEGYKRFFESALILNGYKNSIFYALVGTAINVAITITAAYALSRKDLPGRGIFTFFFAFTMFFNGGLIPTFLLVRSLGLYGSYMTMLLSAGGSAMHFGLLIWNLVIARTYFQNSIPGELLDSAKIDGCTDIRFFRSIVLPLSKAIIAVQIVFYLVGHWNGYFHALVYLRDQARFPLQLILRDILILSQLEDEIGRADRDAMAMLMLSQSMKYAVIILASLPVILVYPYIQKHYVQGIMVGAIKG